MDERKYENENGWNPQDRGRKQRTAAGRVGIFAIGMAVGIAFLAVVTHLLPVRIGAEQTISSERDPDSTTESALNQESVEKLQLLEDCIREYYYEPEDATVETLENGMYKGLMDSLGDPYTVYYTPKEYQSMSEETSGIYKGIGAYIGLQEGTGAPMFTSIMPGTPAEEAVLPVPCVQADEVMPVASPVGYPANKKSIRESLMRKSLKADDRLPFDKLFFENDFGHSLSSGSAFYDALQMARLAPSATNKQPWRAVVIGDTVHFYELKTMKDNPLIDIQKVDIGIALSHFDLTEKENGHSGRFAELDPQLDLPDKTQYIISYERTE